MTDARTGCGRLPDRHRLPGADRRPRRGPRPGARRIRRGEGGIGRHGTRLALTLQTPDLRGVLAVRTRALRSAHADRSSPKCRTCCCDRGFAEHAPARSTVRSTPSGLTSPSRTSSRRPASAGCTSSAPARRIATGSRPSSGSIPSPSRTSPRATSAPSWTRTTTTCSSFSTSRCSTRRAAACSPRSWTCSSAPTS